MIRERHPAHGEQSTMMTVRMETSSAKQIQGLLLLLKGLGKTCSMLSWLSPGEHPQNP